MSVVVGVLVTAALCFSAVVVTDAAWTIWTILHPPQPLRLNEDSPEWQAYISRCIE